MAGAGALVFGILMGILNLLLVAVIAIGVSRNARAMERIADALGAKADEAGGDLFDRLMG